MLNQSHFFIATHCSREDGDISVEFQCYEIANKISNET